LKQNGVRIQHVIFCTLKRGLDEHSTNGMNHTLKYLDSTFLISLSDSPYKIVSSDIQKLYAETWKTLDPNAHVSIQPTIHDALELAKQIGDEAHGMQTLVTGTTRLIGSVLAIMNAGRGTKSV
jgi:folylpolyglutamate synthase